MRIRSLLLVPALALALVGAGCGGDDEPTGAAATGTAPTVTGAWSRATPDVAKTAALYLVATGTGTGDAIVAVSVPKEVAGSATLHETSGEAGGGSATGDMGSMDDMEMMEMRPVEQIAVPADGSVELAPGGLHVMLEELAAPLAAGTTYDAVVRFASGAEVTVPVEVRDA